MMQNHRRVPRPEKPVVTEWGTFVTKQQEESWSAETHHEYLRNKMRFIDYQRAGFLPYHIADYEQLTTGFLGHLPYWTEPMPVMSVFFSAGGVRIKEISFIPSKDDPALMSGCAFVTIPVTDQETFYSMTKHLLFDFGGAWFAENDAEVQVLDTYCQQMQHTCPWLRHPHLPYTTSSCEQRGKNRPNGSTMVAPAAGTPPPAVFPPPAYHTAAPYVPAPAIHYPVAPPAL